MKTATATATATAIDPPDYVRLSETAAAGWRRLGRERGVRMKAIDTRLAELSRQHTAMVNRARWAGRPPGMDACEAKMAALKARREDLDDGRHTRAAAVRALWDALEADSALRAKFEAAMVPRTLEAAQLAYTERDLAQPTAQPQGVPPHILQVLIERADKARERLEADRARAALAGHALAEQMLCRAAGGADGACRDLASALNQAGLGPAGGWQLMALLGADGPRVAVLLDEQRFPDEET